MSTFHAEFNARWLSPVQVAEQFVPIPQFDRLLQPRHSLLLGPRGSGKTTLLKMITREALAVWRQRQHSAGPLVFTDPEFEAIYIPSDVRWSYELKDLDTEPLISQRTAQLVQRCLVSSSVMLASLDAFERVLIETGYPEERFCHSLIDLWHVSDAVPTFADLRRVVLQVSDRIRGLLNRGKSDGLDRYLDSLPDLMFGHALDLPTTACRHFSDVFSKVRKTRKWALCYDELEIAPAWLRQEVIESLRSTDQDIVLKLTSAPVLPTGLLTEPEPAHDYQIVRLWNSHVEDSQRFCEDLTTRFLRARFPSSEVLPDDFLGFSHLAADEDRDSLSQSYRRGGFAYNEMQALAKEDQQFRFTLARLGLNPDDPFTDNVDLRDQLLRKVKPIVLLRRVFRKADRRRSRKVITAYAGKQAVYTMSEGNPRWMLGLLNDLHDRWKVTRPKSRSGKPTLPHKDQAWVLRNTAMLFHTGMAAKAAPDVKIDGARDSSLSLATFLDTVGKKLANAILEDEFPVDPYGSFIVDGFPSPELKELLKTALYIGALVHVGSSADDVPRDVMKARLRPTFMLAPVYRLPLRNYRSVPLSSLLGMNVSADQFGLNFDPQSLADSTEGER